MNFKTTLVLVVLVAAVGGYFLFVERGRDRGPAAVEVSEDGQTLLGEASPERDAVRQVAVRRGDEAVVLFRDSDAWWQVEPVRFGVRSESARQIVERTLGLTWRERFLPGESADDDRPTLAEVGLDTPRAELTLTADATSWTVLLGRRMVDGQAYVQLAGDERIYIVDDGLHRAVLDETIRDWRRRQLEAPRAARAERVVHEHDGQTIELTKQDGRWYLDADDETLRSRASESRVDALVEAVRSLTISSFVADARDGLSTYGVDEPTTRVAVHTPDVGDGGRSYVLRIGAAADLSEREHYATWSVDEEMSPVVFTVERRGVDRLAVVHDELRDPRIVTTRPSDVSEVYIERADEPALHLVRDPDVGYRFGEDGPAYGADYTAASELIDAIARTEAVSYETGFEPTSEPRATVTLLRRGGREEQVQLFEDPGPELIDDDSEVNAAATYLAVREDERVAYRVSAEGLASVFAPLVAYRDMQLMNVRADDVAGVTLTRDDGAEFVFTRDEEGEWQLEGHASFERRAFDGLLAALRPLRAERWLDASAEHGEGFGWAVLTVERADGSPTVLHVDVSARQGAMADEAIGFELPRSFVDRLRDEYRPRTVLSLRAGEIEQIRRELPDDETLTLRRTSGGQYLSDGDTAVREQPAAALFDTLSSLRVWRYIDEPDDREDEPERQYVIERTEGDDYVVELWRLSDGVTAGRVGDRWFQMDGQTMDALYDSLLEDEEPVAYEEPEDVPMQVPVGDDTK
ncbi:DUF4340 domain-containing protein [Phycisphaerales bacterium AB-hyl4]|uniref:DUF4340 domain-containing protein n=1 Tax=Natronomicrosphaera hydrolytica TaxID=3242702 RepID=A0ABV4U987_9BACT